LNGEPDPAGTAIKAHLEVLQWALDTSKFEAEAANIRCVMKGYNSGAITYSTYYTLIWAGRIVDIVSHYNEFTRDRSARLDRYFGIYGPGWFFYEIPLKVHPSIKPQMGVQLHSNVATASTLWKGTMSPKDSGSKPTMFLVCPHIF
jgi:hypothetical protein